MSEQVGIRELRRSLGTYLRRAAAGERLVVTDRNRPVAMLAPLPENDDPIERLIAEGKATRPAGNLLDMEPFLRGEEGRAVLEEIERQREDTV